MVIALHESRSTMVAFLTDTKFWYHFLLVRAIFVLIALVWTFGQLLDCMCRFIWLLDEGEEETLVCFADTQAQRYYAYKNMHRTCNMYRKSSLHRQLLDPPSTILTASYLTLLVSVSLSSMCFDADQSTRQRMSPDNAATSSSSTAVPTQTTTHH